MPTSTDVTNLKINQLTEAQYNAAVQGGVIGANELSIITDLDDAIQVDTLPTASATEEGKIYQFIGTTTASYTNGYFYKCVSDGQNPATYSWTQVNVQPAPVVPDPLPSQTGNAGKFLTTDGTDASWAAVNALQNTATASGGLTILGTPTNQWSSINIGTGTAASAGFCVCIGRSITSSYQSCVAISGAESPVSIGGYRATLVNGSSCGSHGCAIGFSAISTGESSIALGQSAEATQTYSIGIGSNARSVAYGAIQLGFYGYNSEPGTFKVSLLTTGQSNTNYKLLDSDGTIPTDRFTTTPSSDGTYVPTLTISSGTATRSWAAPSGAPTVPSTMPTLAVNDWASNTQTVNVTGVTASNVVFVSPAPASAADYAAAGITCTAQGSGTLTFTCTTVPSNAITVNIVIFG